MIERFSKSALEYDEEAIQELGGEFYSQLNKLKEEIGKMLGIRRNIDKMIFLTFNPKLHSRLIDIYVDDSVQGNMTGSIANLLRKVNLSNYKTNIIYTNDIKGERKAQDRKLVTI